MLFITLMFLATNHLANGFKSGAPPLSCRTMIPSHGVGVQTTTAPYNISVVNIGASDGIIRARIYATSSYYFVGFLVTAKGFPSRGTNSLGTFIAVPEDSSIIDCGQDVKAAVTHTNNSKKQSVEVDWKPPADFEGSVVFIGTFVYNYSTFWTGVESLPVQIGKRSTGSRIDSSLSAALLSVYNGCGSVKNCLSYPENCIITKSCEGVVSVVATDSSAYQIEMFAKNAKYVSVGFSEDDQMGEDTVVECVHDEVSVKPYRSWNEPNRKHNTRLNPQLYEVPGVAPINGLFADGTIYCKIKVDAITYVQNKKFDLNSNEYFLLLAAGKEADANGVGYHDVFRTSSRSRRLLSEVLPEFIPDSFYDGCDNTKTCFGVPDGCVEKQNCNAVTSVSVQGNKYVVSMSARGAAYVATGFSDDRLMSVDQGNDNVVECVRNGTGVQAFRSWNTPNRKDNSRSGINGVEFLNGGVVDDVLKCTVSYDPTFDRNFDVNRQYYLLLAAGTSANSDKVGYHNLIYRSSEKRVSLGNSRPSDSFYQGCGRTKSCFGNPDGCINSQNCRVALTMSIQDRFQYIFNMFALNAAYVAVGFSDDGLMGNEPVFECVREDENNFIKPFVSWNIPEQKANNRVRQNYLTLLNGSYSDGKLQCSVLLSNPVFVVEGRTFDLSKEKYVLLLAAGSSVTPSSAGNLGRVGYHDLVRTAAAEKRSLADVSALRAASKLYLHLHGSFMIASWIGLASLGIVLARYYKSTWVGSSLCGKDIWFSWHRTFMFITWVLTIAGVVLIYLEVGGIVTGPAQTHALLGIITAILAFIQPIGAAFRPHPDSSRRPIFNWLHWFIGNAAHIVAIVTIFLAVDLSKAELPRWTDWILAAYVAFYVIVHLFLSITGYMSEKSGGIRINAIQMKDMNSGRNIPHQFERRKDAAYSGTRKFIFTIHFLVTGAITVLLILLVVYAPVV